MPKEKVKRSRKRRIKIDKTKTIDRILNFFDTDDQARSIEKEIRIQRYAKFRMWTEGSDYPWPESSDMPLPDLMEKSLHLQDVLHNAVIAFRPAIEAKAVREENADKEDLVDKLLDYQMFVDQKGDDIIGNLIEAFVNDGVYFALIPWVKDTRRKEIIATYPPLPDEMEPADYFRLILESEYGGAQVDTANGWDWVVLRNDGNIIDTISFYTDGAENQVEAVAVRKEDIFDGPMVIQKSWEEVIYPSHAENLQAPGPSNPGGAGHVILVDYPSIDEIRRLKKSGFYDLVTEEDITRMALVSGDRDKDSADSTEAVKDALQGVEHPPQEKEAKEQRRLTRLTVFDFTTLNKEGGLAEDYTFRIIKETETLLRARKTSEDFPSSPQRRPLSHRAFIEVRGRVAGISLLEILEGLHDVSKTIIDQVIDDSTIKISPPFFYRPSSSIKPEILKFSPGEGYPLQDPSRDIKSMEVNTQGSVMGLNLFSLVGQMQDKVTTIGDLQLGRIPSGSSSALRTSGNLALVSGQAEARPQHILGRLFSGISEIYSHMHGLNLRFLSDEKKIRVIGFHTQDKDPYFTIRPVDIEGDFIFTFSANVFNSSKQALQSSLQTLFSLFVNPLMLQMGLIDSQGVFKLARQIGKAFGQDADQILNAPSPQAIEQKITAEEAVSTILDTKIPSGIPMEAGGAQEHFLKLKAFIDSDEVALMTPPQQEIMSAYMQQIVQRAQIELQQQQIVQAASQRGGGGGGGNGQGPGRPPEPGGAAPDTGNPPLNQNELLDETLPGAGGGANADFLG